MRGSSQRDGDSLKWVEEIAWMGLAFVSLMMSPYIACTAPKSQLLLGHVLVRSTGSWIQLLSLLLQAWSLTRRLKTQQRSFTHAGPVLCELLQQVCMQVHVVREVHSHKRKTCVAEPFETPCLVRERSVNKSKHIIRRKELAPKLS